MPRKKLLAVALPLLLLALTLLVVVPYVRSRLAAPHVEAAGLALAEGDFAPAAREYEAALAIDDSHAAWLGLARARLATGDPAGAAVAYARAADKSSDPALALVAGDLALATASGDPLAYYRQAESLASRRDDRALLAEARLRLALTLHRGDIGEAWIALQEGLKVAPPAAVARLTALKAAMEEGRASEAKVPALARAALRLGFPAVAESDLDAWLRNHPDSADAHAYLALSRLALGRPGDALAAADESLRLAPDHELARYVRGSALRQAGDDEAAIAILRPLVAAAPEETAFRLELARAYADYGDYGAAAKEVGVVASRRPDGETFLAAANFYLERAYEPAMALALAERAAALLPDDPAAQSALGWGKHLLRREADATDALRRAIGLAPLSAEAHYRLAVVQESRGQAEEARASYWRAADLDPTGPLGARARQTVIEGKGQPG